jgi:methionine biosynthesis protein MetW
LRILVAIANYGTRNDKYLERLIEEYRKMPLTIDIILLSNTTKNFGPNIQTVVGLPSKDPWSLPFLHKQIFADRMNDYDLFIYSEDDTLITQNNIDAFLKATEVLPPNEIAGFIRSETDSAGNVYFPTAHGHFHWRPGSVKCVGPYTFAFFTNEHSACFILTRSQLQTAIKSGGFLVPPHSDQYDLLVTAATDPYTQCGFRKMVCISHLNDFVVPHLPNKYVGKLGIPDAEMFRLTSRLVEIANHRAKDTALMTVETKLPGQMWSKGFYEPCRPEILSMIPASSKKVLSVGCGSGVIEGELIKRGHNVVGIPLDSVIAAAAEAKGVNVIHGDFASSKAQLADSRFDCILFTNVLHLVDNPVEILESFLELLSPEGRMIVCTPNLGALRIPWRRIRRRAQYKHLANFAKSGMHLTTRRTIRNWFHRVNLKIDRVDAVFGEKRRRNYRLPALRDLAGRWFGWELLVCGRR